MNSREPVLADYHFELPGAAIARAPALERTDARLLTLARASGQHGDRWVRDLPDLVRGDELLVFNDTRVVPARLRGHKPTGGRVELLALESVGARTFLAMGRTSKGFSVGQPILLEAAAAASLGPLYIEEVREDGRLVVRLSEHVEDLWRLCELAGEVPLPPYMERAPRPDDSARYQTVFAREPGAVAAPTAGLHFTDDLLAALTARGCETCFVTLHVGPGTFAPVRVERLDQHRMHSERFAVTERAALQITRARRESRPVLAVGTTVVRTLEAVHARHGEVVPGSGETDIFIREGFDFRVIDQLLTNFHLPGSTLLMLVAAFAGRDPVLAAYRHAVATGYRFFSYGDGMLIR